MKAGGVFEPALLPTTYKSMKTCGLSFSRCHDERLSWALKLMADYQNMLSAMPRNLQLVLLGDELFSLQRQKMLI